jgi:hypothetical protein
MPTGIQPMTKKVTLNYDFVGVFIIVLVASVGYNIYQYFQYIELYTEHADLTWSAQDAEANVVYTRKQLEACKNGTATND